MRTMYSHKEVKFIMMFSPSLAFIFDMDGTLVNNLSYHLQAWMQIVRPLGLDITEEEFLERTNGKTNPLIFRELFGDKLTVEEAEAAALRKEALYREIYAPYLASTPGAISLMDEAAEKGIPLAVATSADPPNVDFVLGGLNPFSRLGAVVSGDMPKHSKPHPDIFLTAATHLGVPAEICVVFEDSYSGCLAAQRAGMRVVALATTTTDRDICAGWPGVIRVVGDFTDVHVAEFLV